MHIVGSKYVKLEIVLEVPAGMPPEAFGQIVVAGVSLALSVSAQIRSVVVGEAMMPAQKGGAQ